MSVSKKQLQAEIITPQHFHGFMDYMPNPDELLSEIGESIDIYRSMMLDGRIKSLLTLRKTAVLNNNWRVVAGDEGSERIAEGIREALQRRNLYHEMLEMLSAVDFGFSVTEVVWELRAGWWMPAALKSRKQERFRFSPSGELVYAGPYGERKLTEPYKFIVHRHDPQPENPYGEPVLKQCYWPYKFKRAGWRFWLTVAEKFGVPTVLAVFETSDEEEAASRASMLAESLAGIQGDAAVGLANVKEVKALEMHGNVSDFRTLIDAANTEISYAVTGQSLATGEAEYGTRAQGTVHQEVMDELVRSDARALAHTIQETLIDWMVELNYGPDAPRPRFEFELEDYANWEIVKGAMEAGVPVSRDDLYNRYGIPRPKSDEDSFAQAPQPPGGMGMQLADDDGFFLPRRRYRILGREKPSDSQSLTR